MAYNNLDIPIEKLAKIAYALNENIMANRYRCKEEKIGTDKFIRKFNITRKNFSNAIRGSGIQYNKSTFLYEIPKQYLKDVKNIGTKKNIEMPRKDNNIELISKNKESIILNKKISDVVKNVIKTNYPEIDEIKDMIDWYKSFKAKENIIEIPEININNPKLKGNVIAKTFKTYESVINEFIIYCKSRNETQKDLLALALIEFMSKYKK